MTMQTEYTQSIRQENKRKDVARYGYALKLMNNKIFTDYLLFGNELRKIERKKKHTTEMKLFLREHCATLKRLYCNKQQKKKFPVIKEGVEKVKQSQNGKTLPVKIMKKNLKEFLKLDFLNWARKNLNNMKLKKKQANDERTTPKSFICTLSTPFHHTFRLILTQKELFQADLE